jgi:thioredoxin reductase (NADPH)
MKDGVTPLCCPAGDLTVDDDPGFSRSIARDLGRRYGENYRTVRAESWGQALDALKAQAARRAAP